MVRNCGVAVLAVWTVAIAAPARAQGVSDPSRAAAIVSGGFGGGGETDGALGVEGGLRLTSHIAVFVEAGRLSNVTPDTIQSRAQRIAGLAGVSARTTAGATTVDAGARLRLPFAARVNPFVSAAFGAARVRTSTDWTARGAATPPGALGIQEGSDLSGTSTKPLLVIGGGIDVPIASRLFVEGAVHWARMFARADQVFRDMDIDAARIQAGLGVRF